MKADKSLNDELTKHWYYEKHAPRVSQVIAAVAKVSCKHGLWLVARIKKAGDPAKSQKSSAYIQAVWLKTRENLIPGSHYIMEEFVCKGESE